MITLVWEKYIAGRKKCTRFRVAAYSVHMLGDGSLEWYRCKLPAHLTDFPEAVRTGHRVTWQMTTALGHYCRERGMRHEHSENFRKRISKDEASEISDIELMACLGHEPEEAP